MLGFRISIQITSYSRTSGGAVFLINLISAASYDVIEIWLGLANCILCEAFVAENWKLVEDKRTC